MVDLRHVVGTERSADGLIEHLDGLDGAFVLRVIDIQLDHGLQRSKHPLCVDAPIVGAEADVAILATVVVAILAVWRRMQV